VDQLRKQVIDQEREVSQARVQRDRADEETRQAQFRIREEYSTG
jgi:hypothetical protein